MTILKKLAFGIASLSFLSASAFAGTIQTISDSNYHSISYMQGGDIAFDTLTFATGTNSISSLTSSVNTADQGWGGSCDCNQVVLDLYDTTGKLVWRDHIAGSNHNWTTYTYDVTANANAFASLNAAMGAMDYSNGGNASLVLAGNNITWGGYMLYVNGATVTVESAAVPEPTSIALMGLGLAGFAFARRKAAKR